jgi:hypothetical protein
VSGRKRTQESRATEFRQRLIEWTQMPESSRPSLRALAREVGTTHQLMNFFLKGLENWQGKQWLRDAEEIRARAYADGRHVTPVEEQRAQALTRAGVRATVVFALRRSLEDLKREAKRGPLARDQIKMLTLFARNGFPGAQELLQMCLQDGLEERKCFADIEKETPAPGR